MLVGGSFTFDPDAGTCGGDVLPICSKEDQEFGLCDLLPIIAICEFLCGPADRPQIESISPDRALIGQPVDILIQGSAFGNNPTLQVDSGISVNVTSSSDTQINARFNVSNVSTNGGFHSVFVQNAHGISNGASFFVQVPTTLFIRAPAFVLSPGVPGGCSDFGVRVAVSYQVLDQLMTPLRSAQMEPKETLTNFFVNGIPQAGSPGLTNIGPFPGIPGTSQFTDANGGFLDAPVGFCPPVSNTSTITQQIFIVAGGIPYITRVNQFSGGSSAPGSGTLTNGFDIEASR
jgi:IPT/TIG domain-containing protein